MNKNLLIAAATSALAHSATFAAEPAKPNVIVLMTDDVGYGDAGCYGAKPEHLKTPNIDRLAAEGVRFTDGHSACAVCTPSRAALLTGDYPVRNQRGMHILPGDAALFIDPGHYTLPGMFKQAGYRTAVVGKWHLGLGKVDPDFEPYKKFNGTITKGVIDWNGLITPGPNEIGFDESFIMPSTADRVPTVFLRNGRVENLDPNDPIKVDYINPIPGAPTAKTNPELANVLLGGKGHDDTVTAGVARIGFMTGGKAALWKDQEISDTLLAESLKFIEKNQTKPFFLYLSTHGIHDPRVPHPRFTDKSGCGVYGDQILELDDLVGRLMAKLKDLNLDENTLVVFTSDNGGNLNGNTPYKHGSRTSIRGHRVNGILRGGKGDSHEGGTRVPFIVRWPGHAEAGKVSPALVSQLDLAASFAAMLGIKLPDGAARDSFNILPALLGKSDTGRPELIEHRLGFRMGNWKLIQGALYDLSTDLGEKINVAKAHPEIVKKMTARLREINRSSQTR